MKVNTRTYVRWLLRQPAAFSVRPPQLQRALQTARLLDDLAYTAQVPEEMREVALKLWCAPFQFGLGSRPKDPDEALRAIKEYEWFIGRDMASRARDFIERLRPKWSDVKHAKALIPRAPSVDGVKYEAPNRVAYLNRDGRKRWPADDLSERIWEAHCALKEAGCPCPSEIVAEELREISQGEDWERQHVESRLKPFKNRKRDKWPENHWRWTYALSYPDSTDGAIPESFEFIPWEAASSKALATGPRSTLRQEEKSGVPRSR